MRPTRHPHLLALAVAALALAACARSGAPATSLRPTGETLDAFFGWDEPDDPDAAEEDFQAQEARVQDAVVACMAEKGFDYEPEVFDEAVEMFSEEAFVDDAEYVATEGFGITTWWGDEEEFDEQLGVGEEWVDPNQEIRDALDPDELLAWEDALWGSDEELSEVATIEVDPDTGEEYESVEGFGPGCMGEAEEAVFGSQDDVWTKLDPLLVELDEQFADDPRVVEANAAWASCMADRGHDYPSQDAMFEEVYDDFQTRLDEILGPNGGFADPFDGWTDEEIDAFFAERSEEEVEEFFAEFEAEDGRADIDTAALEALQQEEIALATDDLECGEELMSVGEDVYAELEVAFVEEHRDELEKIRAAAEAAED